MCWFHLNKYCVQKDYIDHKTYVLRDSNVHAPYMIWIDWLIHSWKLIENTIF